MGRFYLLLCISCCLCACHKVEKREVEPTHATAALSTPEIIGVDTRSAEDIPTTYVPELHPSPVTEPTDRKRYVLAKSSPLGDRLGRYLEGEIVLLVKLERKLHIFAAHETEKEIQHAKAARHNYDPHLYLGIVRGPRKAELRTQLDWQCLLFTVRSISAGQIAVLDHAPFTNPAAGELYILDADGDGYLEAIGPSGWGVSGGGAVDIFRIAPDGKIGRPAGATSIYAAYTKYSLNDFDGDGLWEIETLNHLAYDGASGSYSYTKIYCFDPKSKGWKSDSSRFPELLADQRDFYRAYLASRQALEVRAATVGKRPWELAGELEELLRWRGQSYRHSWSLDSNLLNKLLQDWDGYSW